MTLLHCDAAGPGAGAGSCCTWSNASSPRKSRISSGDAVAPPPDAPPGLGTPSARFGALLAHLTLANSSSLALPPLLASGFAAIGPAMNEHIPKKVPDAPRAFFVITATCPTQYISSSAELIIQSFVCPGQLGLHLWILKIKIVYDQFFCYRGVPYARRASWQRGRSRFNRPHSTG